jgi:flagellum-specific peptidoglycan hydrolase FlgJ
METISSSALMLSEQQPSQAGLALCTTPSRTPSREQSFGPDAASDGLWRAHRDEQLERMWRPEDSGLPPVNEETTANETNAVAQGAGAVAVDGYTGSRRANSSLWSMIQRSVPRTAYVAKHAETSHNLLPHEIYNREKAQDGASDRYTSHRAESTVTDLIIDRTLVEITKPGKRNKIVAIGALVAMSAGIMLGSTHDQEPAKASVNIRYGTDSSHAKPEQVTKIVYEKVAQISPRQEKVIDTLPNLDERQKDNLTDFADAVIKLKYDGKLKDVNTDVMTSQWSQETGNGTSALSAKYHNYFGIKAGKGWKGPKAKVMTSEEVNGKLHREPAYFRVYKSTEAGVLGYRDKLRNSPWFRDALGHPDDSEKTLSALLDDGMAWATDSNYKAHVMGRGRAIHAHDITKVEKITIIKRIISLPKKNPAAKTPEMGGAKDPHYKVGFKLTYGKNDRQQILEVNESGKAWITLPNGKKKLDRDISRAERIKIIEYNLNNADVNPIGYKEFLKDDFIDLTGKVPKIMDNYDGRRNGMGTPKPKGVIKRLVHHYTSTNSNVDYYDGMKFAGTMQHSGPLAVQYDTNKAGKTYWLTKSRTSHVKGFNSTSWGNENHAPSQVGVSADQYQSDIYLDFKFLTENGYIDKSRSITKTVNAMLVGHHEMNPYGHNDYPKPVMDVIRAKFIEFAIQMGYKR